jgi:MFS family permease
MALTNFAVTMPLVLIPIYIRELGASITQLGLFFTISMIFPILVKLFGGWLSDVVGRLQVILIGSVTGVLTFTVYALAPTWEAALLAPALMAITASLTIPAYAAYIADITPEPSRGRMFGVSQTVYRASGVIAPVIGGLLAAAIGFKFMFGVAAIVFAIAAIIFFFLLRTAPSLTLSAQKVSWDSLKSSFAQMWALFVAGGVIAWMLIIDGTRDIAMRLPANERSSPWLYSRVLDRVSSSQFHPIFWGSHFPLRCRESVLAYLRPPEVPSSLRPSRSTSGESLLAWLQLRSAYSRFLPPGSALRYGSSLGRSIHSWSRSQLDPSSSCRPGSSYGCHHSPSGSHPLVRQRHSPPSAKQSEFQ